MPGTYQYDVEIKSNVAKLLSDMKQVQDRLDTVEGKEYKIKLNVDEKKLSNVISNLENMLDSLGKGTSDFKQFENLSKQLSSITTDIGKISKAFATMDDGSGLVNNIKSIDSSLTNLTNHFVLQVSDKMASSIKEVKGTLSDVGDGKELTPLLNTIGRIESAIDRLSSSVKGIGLNMNIDFGSDTEMEAKAQTKISNALQAYQRLFEHIKMSSAGGSIINTKFFDFDINQYDTAMSKLQAYRKFIENMRNEAKAMYGGQDVLFTDTDKKYWTQASSAMGQVTKTFNEMKAASDANPLENIFGKTDLTEVLNQLSAIVSKLDEISMSANRFADVFKNGLNVNASVEEIEKLTNRVKELESELAKIKTPTTVATPQESNISSASTPAIEQQNKLQEELKETQQQAENTAKAILKVTGYRGTNGGDPVTSNKSGATFWDSKKNVANMYGTSSSDKTLWSSELSFTNPFTFDAKKQKYGDITYLGDGADYASREIIELTQRENELRKALDNSTKSGLEEVKMAYELQDVCQRITKISKDTSNPYGTHSTDWFAEYAKNNGYDGVAITNVLDTPDSYAKNGTEVSDVYITFQREQLQNTTLLAKANHELAESEREVALAELGVTQNKATSSNNSLEDKIKSIFTDAKELKQILESLYNGKYFSFDTSENDDALGRVRELQKILDDYGYKIKNFKDDSEAFCVSGVISSLEEENNALDKNTKKIKENQQMRSQTPTKDAIPKTSENLEQVAQSEQKVQQEAVAADKAIDNINFTPNTEGFDNIIAKFGILREQAEQITKIVKITKQTADGTPDISYKATLRNGSSYYLGENSTPQVLNASETVYDTNAIEKAYQEATKVNNALNETNSLLNSLKIPNGFKGSFSTLESEIKRLNSEFGSGKISATEYTNSIKKAFSNYQTPIDNKSKDIWNDLITSLDRYDTLQKRIASNNALSTDNEEATKLLEHIHELQRNDILPTKRLTASNEKLQQINQTVTDLKAKLKESTLDSLQGSIDKYQKIYNQRSTYSSDFTPSEQYTKNLTELNTSIKNLVEYRNALKNVGEVTVEQETHLKGLVAACEKASDSFKSLSASEKGASQIAIDKLVQRINKDLYENTNYSKKAKLGLRALRDELESANPRNLKEIASEMIKIENAEIRAGRAGKSFFDIFKTKRMYNFIGQMQSYLSMYIGFYGVIRYGKEGINTIRELDTAMTEVRKVSNATEAQYASFRDTISSTAKEIATTNKELLNSSADFLRLGYSLDEASDLAKNATLFVNVGDGVDINAATEDMITAMKAFDIQAKDSIKIVDSYNQIGNMYALSATDIGEAMKRSASALETGNNSFEESIALITAMNEIVQNSENTGNTLKVFSLRLRGAKAELEDMGEDTDGLCESTSKLREQLKSLTGVDIMLNDNTFKSTTQIVKELGATWDKLSDSSQAATLELVAGKTRANNVAALLKNYQKIDEVMESLGDAEGSALRENEAIVDSIDGRIKVLSATVEDFWQKFIDTDLVKDTISSLSGILNLLTKIIDKVGLLPTLLTPIGAIIGKKLGYASI